MEFAAGASYHVKSLHEGITLDFCMFGTPWRKRTRLLYCWVELLPLILRCSSHRGICDIINSNDQNSEGKKKGTTVYWTSLAEPYPRQFCNLWARFVKDIQATRALWNLSSVLQYSSVIGSGSSLVWQFGVSPRALGCHVALREERGCWLLPRPEAIF